MSDIAPEPAAPAAEPAVEPAAESAWSGPSQDEWTQAMDAISSFGELITAAEAAAAAEQQPQINVLSDDFESQLDQWYDRKTEPIRRELAYYRGQEGNARADDILHDLQSKPDGRGEFLFADSAAWARAQAESYFPEMLQQFPRDPARAAEAAVSRAYEAVREWEDAVGKAYYEREVNELRGLSRAPLPPAPASARPAPQQIVVPEGGDEKDLVRHYFPR